MRTCSKTFLGPKDAQFPYVRIQLAEYDFPTTSQSTTNTMVSMNRTGTIYEIIVTRNHCTTEKINWILNSLGYESLNESEVQIIES